MSCYQCEQAAGGKGCSKKMGVCGKNDEVAALQDLLVYSLKGLALVAEAGRKAGVDDREVNVFTSEALFSTLTNVDFDPARFDPFIRRSVRLRESLKAKVKAAGGTAPFSHGSATFFPAAGLDGRGKGFSAGLHGEGRPADVHVPSGTRTFSPSTSSM